MSNGSDTTYTISIAGKVITLTPSTGTAQTITIPDDLDMGFDSSGADKDKELRFIVQELTPSGKRDFSVTLASTGSSSERRYSFMKGAGTGSIASTTDPDGIVRSVTYIGSGATAFPRAERRKFRFQFGEPARKNRSLTGAKLVVNGTEHDLEDWGISSDRRYREVRTSDAVSYRYRSGSAVTFNLKFADGTYLGYTSETKATRTLLKEDMKGALGITDVRENVTSVLQDTPDAVVSTSGEDAVSVSVPFDFHTVYDDAGMSPVYDAAAKRISFGGLSNSERTSVVVRSNVRLRHNGGECSVELSLREFRGASETNRWVLARRDLDERGTLFAFDLAGESVEAEMSGGRYYRFDIDVKRSGDENATAGVHGTSAHVINFASFERVEGDRRWSPRENLAWPPNQASSVRLTYGDRGSGLKTTGYFFGDDEAEAEVPFSREWKGVIDAGNARVEFDLSYSGKSGSLRSPYDFKVAGSWILSDGTVSDWEEKVEVSTTASSGSQSLMFTPPSTATGMYLRYMRETNTFTGSSDEITFAAGDPVIRYVSGGGLTQAQVDARVAAGVQDWAEAGNNTAIPNAKLPTILTQVQVDARVAAGVQDWAEAGNNTTVPDAKLPTILTQAQVDARVAAGVQDWAEAGNNTTVPDAKLPTILTQAQVDARVAAGVQDWAEAGNNTTVPDAKLPTILTQAQVDTRAKLLAKMRGVGDLPNISGYAAGDLWLVPNEAVYEAVAATEQSATLSVAGLVPTVDGDDYQLPRATFPSGITELACSNGAISVEANSGVFGHDGFDIVIGNTTYYCRYDETVAGVDTFFATGISGLAWATNALPANSYIHSRSTKPFTASGKQWSKAFAHGGIIKSVSDRFTLDTDGKLGLNLRVMTQAAYDALAADQRTGIIFTT